MNEKSYVKSLENGDVLLSTGELLNGKSPSGLPLTSVILSCMGFAFRWFTDFLTETETISECKTTEKSYRAFRTANAVYLEEIRGSGFANVVGFSLAEINTVLGELQQATVSP
jgi:hypothetical protein